MKDEIRIKVHAIGLNFADVFAVLGFYELAGDPPLTPGFEVAGVVDEIGPDVTHFKRGDSVWGLCRFGCYTTVINIRSPYCMHLPSGWDFAAGAGYPAQTFTAWYALCVLGGLPFDGSEPVQVTSARRVVLIHSAAGGVGLRLVEMVKGMGGEVVCVVGSERKAEILEGKGVERRRIVVRGVDDVDGFEKVVRERALGGGGVDVVVDSVMGRYFEPGYNLLNRGGRYIVMGSASLMPSGGVTMRNLASLVKVGWGFWKRPRLDLVKMINENKSVAGFNVGDLFGEVDMMRRGFVELEQMKLDRPKVGRVFNFEDVHDALRFFQSGESVGKIVLRVSDES